MTPKDQVPTDLATIAKFKIEILSKEPEFRVATVRLKPYRGKGAAMEFRATYQWLAYALRT